MKIDLSYSWQVGLYTSQSTSQRLRIYGWMLWKIPLQWWINIPADYPVERISHPTSCLSIKTPKDYTILRVAQFSETATKVAPLNEPISLTTKNQPNLGHNVLGELITHHDGKREESRKKRWIEPAQKIYLLQTYRRVSSLGFSKWEVFFCV